MTTTETILVVDDEKMIREIISMGLIAAGYQVVVAEDGDEALEAMKHRDFNLVLTDLSMARMSGDVLMKNAKKIPKLSTVPFIVVTGSLDSNYNQEQRVSIKEYSRAILLKPFSIRVLIQTVRSVLQQHSTEKLLNTHRAANY